ncbi:MAG: asparagine synthase (glutamine-hydrolyzing) [Gemmatimonadales bacterium]
MCGIVGFYRPEGLQDGDQALVQAAVATLRHRGPDGAGFWSGAQVAFGHARLSIIDLATGQQPLFNEDGAVGVILNGEIYNYQDLSSELKARGHVFRSNADTEVIVHGYEEWGDDVVNHLDGMFAFVVWDGRRQRLLMARDRFGEKPLYYTSLPGQPGTIWFASEIKALLTSESVPRELAAANLDEYLLYRHVIAPGTMFRGIYQLRPGHLMVVDGEQRRETCYYQDEPDGSAEPANLEALESLLSGSVIRRLMSDVNLGTVLSGGIDSSLVSAIAARHLPGLDTFCVGFTDPKFDERPHARAVAEAIGSRHHELVLAPEDIPRELHRLTWANDEPLTHPNSIAMHLVFGFAKREHGVTVLLSGEGADEVFGGYDWYRSTLRREAALRWPGFGLAARLMPGHRGSVMRRLADPNYPLLANGFATPAAASRMLGREWLMPETRRAAWPDGQTGVDGMFRYDQRTYLPALLQRQDRMSMAAGVEARVVFLSHFLVEWANRLPTSSKVSAEGRKLPLRHLVRQLLPEFALERPKVGFALPLANWMASGGDLGEAVAALPSGESMVGGWCDRSAIQALVEEQSSGQDHTDDLWTLLALEEWGQTFLSASAAPVELPGASSSLLSPPTTAPGHA